MTGGLTTKGRITAPAVGSALGAFGGSEIGRLLDEKDRIAAAQAEFDALESGAAGASRDWRNPANGHSGQVTPGPAYSVNEYTCRDFTHKVSIDDRQQSVRGTACRQPDGSWRPLT